MKYLLDENLHESTAKSLDALAGPGEKQDEVHHILEYHPPGAQDPVIPRLCREHGVDVLVSANVRDFGARLYYYQALLAEEIDVVVVRPGRPKSFGPAVQVGIIAQNYGRMSKLLSNADEPTLLKMTPSSVQARTIDELVAEIEGKLGRLP